MQDLLKDCRTPWFNVHSIFDELPWSPEACRVYLHLSRRAGQQASAWPSYQSIGNTCFKLAIAQGKLSAESARRKAMRAVEELIELGLVSRSKRRTQDSGANQSNVYTLTHCDQWKPGVATSNHHPSDVTSLPLVTSNHHPSDVTSPKGIPREGNPREGNPREGSSSDRDRALGKKPPTKVEPFPVFDSHKTVRRIEMVQTIPRWDINAPWSDDEERKRFDEWLRVKYAAKHDPPRYAAVIVGKVAKGEPSVDWEEFQSKPQVAIAQSREAEVLAQWGDRQDWENFPLLDDWRQRCDQMGWLDFCNLGNRRNSAHDRFTRWIRGIA